jgi:hypothetical protein
LPVDRSALIWASITLSTFRLMLTLILNFASKALARAARFAGAWTL